MASVGSQADAEDQVEGDGTQRMTSNGHEFDDRELDTMIESLARAGAPDGFAGRVSAAIDARDASPSVSRRPAFAMAAVAAAIAVLAGAIWITSRRATTPPPSIVARDTAPATPSAIPAPTIAPSVAPPEQMPSVAMAPRGAHTLRHRPSTADDHDRALPALASLPGVGPHDISPAAMQTAPLEIDRIDDIAPLTIQGGRDTSGRGDY